MAAPAPTDSNGKKLCCDACDGPHLTAECPLYKGKAREKHKDGQKGKPKEIGSGTGGNLVLTSGQGTTEDGTIAVKSGDTTTRMLIDKDGALSITSTGTTVSAAGALSLTSTGSTAGSMSMLGV